jgi:resuscitation-promoting factor RpfB
MTLGAAAFARSGKDVTLVVDERARQVGTFAGTVGDLLEQEEIAVDQHDRVSPPISASLADGMRVNVELAKEITLLSTSPASESRTCSTRSTCGPSGAPTSSRREPHRSRTAT